MNPNDPRTKLLLEYEGLGDEETQGAEVCPACEGGTSEEKSLSVTRRGDVLLYNCHRASCEFRGSVRVSGFQPRFNDTSQQTKSSPVRVPTTPINQAFAKLLATRYGITTEVVEFANVGWTGDGLGTYERRISYPIYGPDSKQRGSNYRSYQGAKPKSLIKLNSEDELALAWYKYLRTSNTLVLVEDQVSAMRLAPYVHAVALLGTHISEAKAEEIKEGKYKNIVLSLDPDAVGNAIKLQLYWRNKLPNMCVVGIPTDVKDMDKDEFNSYLRRIQDDDIPF